MAESDASAPCPVTYAAATDVGRRREQNEDSHGEFELPGGDLLLVVADGMGGHQGGEVASRIAVEALGHIARHSPARDPREKLHNGLLVAHQRVLTHAETAGTSGMGTTAVAVYLRGSEAYVAHIGDSRLYHLRGGAISWRTLDHTRVERMVRMGILSPEQAKNHPDANIVTRAIGHDLASDGTKLEPEVQEEPLLLLPGDVIVLCSDGVYDDVTDPEIAAIATSQAPQAAAQALVDLANERGGSDNITVSILKYGDRPAQALVAQPPAAAPKEAAPPVRTDGAPPAPRTRRGPVVAGVIGVLVLGAVGLGTWRLLRRGSAPAPTSGLAQDLSAPAVPDLATRPVDLAVAPAVAPAAPAAAPAQGTRAAAPQIRPAVKAPAAAAKPAAPAQPPAAAAKTTQPPAAAAKTTPPVQPPTAAAKAPTPAAPARPQRSEGK